MNKKDVKDIVNFASVGLFMVSAGFVGGTLSATMLLLVLLVNNTHYALNNDEYNYISAPIDFEKELSKHQNAHDFFDESFGKNDTLQHDDSWIVGDNIYTDIEYSYMPLNMHYHED